MKFFSTFFFILHVLFLNAQIERADSIKAAEYSIKNLKANSANSDFGTTFYGKNKIVFSSSRKVAGVSKRKWDGNDQPFLDLYIGDVTSNGDIVKVKPFSNDVNSKYHDAMVAFSPNLKDVYFTSNNYMHGKLKSSNLKIFKATIGEDGRWTDIKSLPFNSDDYDTGQPMISKDGKKLYFVSNMPGTLGDTDIFVVDLNEGHYGKPINLGPTINSKYKEYTPFIDGDVVYFSSNRKGGKGGLDIYMAKLDGSTPKPINLGKPMNSKGDDFSFIIDSDKLQGYFSSNRSRGTGDDDIYSFVQTTTIPICDQIITGIIKDEVTGLRVHNAFVALIDKDGKQRRKIETKFDGKFYFNADCGTKYTLKISKVSYFGSTNIIETSNTNGFDNNKVIFIKEKEFIERNGGRMLNVENIKFTINTAEITERSEKALDKVVRLMSKYPEMVIEFGSHTDSRGPDGYNLSLSKRRASATVTYLLDKGILPRRITGKGYGETVPLNKCVNGVKCTNLEYDLNKRTEFTVIKI